MAFYNNRSFALDRGLKRAPRRPLGPVGHRLAGVLRGTGDPDNEATSVLEAATIDPETLVEPIQQRFPLALRGYARGAVDDYVSDLERELAALDRELAELRGGGAGAHQVEIEIKRIGEQTSAVLMAAHEQREEILREARAEAERCVAEASVTATSLTTDSEQRLRELGAQTEAAQAERDRLLGDLRKISSALAAVADSARPSAVS